MRPAAVLHGLAEYGEARVRTLVLAVLLGWTAFVGAVGGGLALLTWLLGGPWWLYWVSALVGVVLLAPAVFLAIVVLGTIRAWKEATAQAQQVERAVFDDETLR